MSNKIEISPKDFSDHFLNLDIPQDARELFIFFDISDDKTYLAFESEQPEPTRKIRLRRWKNGETLSGDIFHSESYVGESKDARYLYIELEPDKTPETEKERIRLHLEKLTNQRDGLRKASTVGE